MDEAIERLKRFFNNETMMMDTLHSNYGNFKSIAELLFENIDDLSKGDRIKEGNGVSSTRLLENIDTVREYVLFGSINENSVMFFEDWVLLIHNWNENVTKSDNLRLACRSVEMFVKGRKTMDETIAVLKTLNERMQRVKSWNPPAFEVSRSFLEYLDKD